MKNDVSTKDVEVRALPNMRSGPSTPRADIATAPAVEHWATRRVTVHPARWGEGALDRRRP
jgi:hypothetical protein